MGFYGSVTPKRAPCFIVFTQNASGEKHAKALMGPIPPPEYSGSKGSKAPNHGLPRFAKASFDMEEYDYFENLDVFCILKYKITEASINVNPFANHTGKLLVASPYINHISVPKVKRIYMDKEMDEVSLVRMVFNACGKKEVEVKTAAAMPVT